MRTYELTPVNWRKSFYWKCEVVEINLPTGETVSELWSYETMVARYTSKGWANKMEVFGWYSNTTASHINAFLYHFWYETTNKKGMEEREDDI